MKKHIVRASPVDNSFRTQSVAGMFDLPNQKCVEHAWDIELPIEGLDWQIGAIVGPSGSGKSVLAAECFPGVALHTGFDWPANKSLLDGFDSKLGVKDIVGALNAVGFSSPPHWLKPFSHLSNGQKFRAELARCILQSEGTVVFDEFTSVVDRQVAKACSAACSKFLRKRKAPRFVALSCHYDILDWLEPDWVFDVGSMRFEGGRLRRRPAIKIEVRQVGREAWSVFRGHHYLSAALKPQAACYCAFWSGEPVAICAVLPFPHPRVKSARREHRLVVLPDYQGIGIGSALAEFVAGFYTQRGHRYFSTSSHPAIIAHRARSLRWRMLRAPGHTSMRGRTSSAMHTATQRLSLSRGTASFEYIGAQATKNSPQDTPGATARRI